MDNILIEYEDIRGVVHREILVGDFYDGTFIVDKIKELTPPGMGKYASALVTCEYTDFNTYFPEYYFMRFNFGEQ